MSQRSHTHTHTPGQSRACSDDFGCKYHTIVSTIVNNTIVNNTICVQHYCEQHNLGTTLLCNTTVYCCSRVNVSVPTDTPGRSSVDPVQGKLVVTTLAATGCAINLDFFPEILVHTDDILSTLYF